MKYVKLLLKGIGYILLIPIIYILISLILTHIPVAEKTEEAQKKHIIYLTTNGVHSDIVLPKKLITPKLLKGQKYHFKERYFAFGWGEENLKSKTLVHVTRYRTKRDKWIAVTVTDVQLQKLNAYILAAFDENENGKQLVEGATYTPNRDNFYRANGNYMFYKTCNTWANAALKESGMKASLWTPFDFGVLRWYKE